MLASLTTTPKNVDSFGHRHKRAEKLMSIRTNQTTFVVDATHLGSNVACESRSISRKQHWRPNVRVSGDGDSSDLVGWSSDFLHASQLFTAWRHGHRTTHQEKATCPNGDACIQEVEMRPQRNNERHRTAPRFRPQIRAQNPNCMLQHAHPESMERATCSTCSTWRASGKIQSETSTDI